MEKKIKIVLLGKTGQIGSELEKKLKKNKNIKCLSRKDLKLEDYSSIENKLNKLKPNILINAAAYTKVYEAEKNKSLCRKINSISVKKIAEWAHQNNCFLLHYSTDYVFDGKNKNSWKENDKTNPINVYGKSKLEGEKFIILSNCKYLILRINWIYANKGENFPQKIIKKIKKEIVKEYDVKEVDTTVEAGSGSFPLQKIDSCAIRFTTTHPDRLKKQFLKSDHPMLGYIKNNNLFFDFKSITNDQVKLIPLIINKVLA